MAKKKTEAAPVLNRVNAPLPEQMKIRIFPHEIGTKYVTIGERFGAPLINRELIPSKVKEFAGSSWDGIQGTQMCLLKVGDNIFAIVDGNNRGNGVLERNEPGDFNAIVYEWGVNIFSEEDIEWLFFQKSGDGGKVYTANDRLYSLQTRSIWPQIFSEEGLNPLYQQGELEDYRWMTVLSASSIAEQLQNFVNKGRSPLEFRPNNISMTKLKGGVNEVKELWLSQDHEDIRDTAKALKMWQPTIEHLRTSKISILWSSHCLAIVIALYKCTDDRKLLRDNLDRMVKHIKRKDFAEKGPTSKFGELVASFMQALNAHRTSRTIALGTYTR